MFSKEYIFSIDRVDNKFRVTGFKRTLDKKNYRVIGKEELKKNNLTNISFDSMDVLKEYLIKITNGDCDILNFNSIYIEKQK